ncbi:MAG TPA: hypothetical protein VIM64_22490 [Puia sp.]
MPQPYLTFEKFSDPDLAAAVAEHLKNSGIDYSIENEGPILDATIIGDNSAPTIHLKIAGDDFTRAHAILEDYYQSQLKNIDPDYYLFSFTNAELMEIMQRPDEWGHLDYALAKRLLAERGQEITPIKADQLRQERLTELAKPEKPHGYQIVFGYAGALIGFLGGLTGASFGLWSAFAALVLGYILAYLKKTLPNGETVYIYSSTERKHGKRILVLAIIAIPVWFLLLIRGAER